MNHRGLLLLAVLWSTATADEPLVGPAPGDVVLKRQRDIQERARTLATELMGNVLDQQLRRLEENGLGSLPLHAEIEMLRGSIETLAAEEMQEVVDLLIEADAATGPAREALILRSQRLVRRISVQLAAEQRQLLRRLKVADMAAQVRRLTGTQETALAATEGIPRQAEGQVESATASAIEQQKTVKSLFAGLLEMLGDVRGWDGSIGVAAAEGLRNLRTAGVAKALDTAEDRLGAVDIPAAMEAQRTVLAALEDLLKTIERAQGFADKGDEGNAGVARQLLERARELRQKIEKSPLDDRDVESLTKEQSRLRDAIRELATTGLGQQEKSLAERAGDSVEKSIEKIFEEARQEAVARQDKAIDALEDLVEKLEQAGRTDSGERSSVELAKRLDDMRKAAAQLAQVAREQDAAADAARTDPPAAAMADQRISEAVLEIGNEKDLPQSVRERLEEAAQAAEDAGEELAEAANDPKERQEGEQAAEAAKQAVKEAGTQIEKSIAETERQRLATKVDELSKAANAIERAAAKEKDVARQAAALAKRHPTEAAERRESATETAQAQRDVSETVEKVAEAVQQTAAEAARDLAQSQQSRAAAQERLDRIAEGEKKAGEEPAGPERSGPEQPGAEQPENQTGKQQADNQRAESRKAAAEASARAEQAADFLKKAAQSLREEAAAAAEELAKTAERQAGQQQAKESDTTGSEESTGSADTAARQAESDRDQAIGETMSDRLAGQQQAREQIEAMAKKLEDWAERLPPELQMARGQRPGEDQARDVARELFKAQRDYARAQHDLGEDAATVSGQEEVVDRPLREGLDRASQLKLAERDGSSPGAGEPQQTAPDQQPGATPASSPTEIEQGSPEDTARMITGTRAQQIAESLLEPPPAPLAMSQQSQQSQSQQSQSQQSQSQQSQSQQSQSQQSQSQQSQSQQSQSQQSQSQQQPPGQQGGTSSNATSDTAETAEAPPPRERPVEQESWFAKLPPGVRDAIRAKGQRRAPRGYEEKLDRYFKNLE